MNTAASKLRAFYEMTPDAPFYQQEFGFYSMDRWKQEGHITEKTDLRVLFGFDGPGSHSLGQLGWCESAFYPFFDEQPIEDRGKYELVRDKFGRSVLYFKGRRSGFMPEYLAHPVKDRKTWEDDVKWRLDPKSEGRFSGLDTRMNDAKKAESEGFIITQNIIGGYMYLRSLFGPVELLYMFHDDPSLIHDCMKTWFELADAVTAVHQEHVCVDELFFGEDICFNHGPLISPDMIKEFLLPYYSQLHENMKKRQTGRTPLRYFHIDTDGFADPVIELYSEIGMNCMSPFEAASGCDVVRTGKEYPKLRIKGGFDKRILAEGKDAIDKEISRIMPAMKKRGGYVPTCDHGVPEEVSFENYMHYRKRMLDY